MAVSPSDGRARVQACVTRALQRGEPFPTARSIREATGLSLATVHKHVHQLAAEGLISLPDRYPERSAPVVRRVLGLRRKRLLLAGGESMTLSLLLSEEGGCFDADIVGLETSSTRPMARRVLSCQDLSPTFSEKRMSHD